MKLTIRHMSCLGNETAEAIVDGQLHELVKRAFEAVGLTVTTGSANEMLAAQDDCNRCDK